MRDSSTNFQSLFDMNENELEMSTPIDGSVHQLTKRLFLMYGPEQTTKIHHTQEKLKNILIEEFKPVQVQEPGDMFDTSRLKKLLKKYSIPHYEIEDDKNCDFPDENEYNMYEVISKIIQFAKRHDEIEVLTFIYLYMANIVVKAFNVMNFRITYMHDNRYCHFDFKTYGLHLNDVLGRIEYLDNKMDPSGDAWIYEEDTATHEENFNNCQKIKLNWVMMELMNVDLDSAEVINWITPA